MRSRFGVSSDCRVFAGFLAWVQAYRPPALEVCHLCRLTAGHYRAISPQGYPLCLVCGPNRMQWIDRGETLLKGGWQIAGYTSTLDDRSAFILFRHPDETYLVQCRASYDVTRTPSAHSNCYKLQ